MAKRGRRPPDIEVKDGPISEALREAVEASGISKYALAKEVGISKPQFYRFLKGERDLSQKALNNLATRLGVRVVFPEDGGMDRTESRDSVAGSTTETGVGLSPDPLVSADRLSRTFAILGLKIDEEFAAFEDRLAGQIPGPRREGPGVWDRLRGWMRVPNRGDAGGSPGDQPMTEQTDPSSLNKQSPAAGVSPPILQELLDSFRSSVKLLVKNCVEEVMSDPRPSRSDGTEATPSQTPSSPAGIPGELRTADADLPETTSEDEWTTQTII